MSGSSDFSVAFQAGEGVRLSVMSDLVGLESFIPAPFTKARDVPQPLRFDLDVSETPEAVVRYGMCSQVTGFSSPRAGR